MIYLLWYFYPLVFTENFLFGICDKFKLYLWVHINRVVIVSWRVIAWAICIDGFIPVGTKSLLKDNGFSFVP